MGLNRNKLFDERFLLHRYKSTSHAAMAAALLMAGWLAYAAIVQEVLRWDFILILGVMVVVKWTFMLWYRTHD
jgi:hypothetical protein